MLQHFFALWKSYGGFGFTTVLLAVLRKVSSIWFLTRPSSHTGSQANSAVTSLAAGSVVACAASRHINKPVLTIFMFKPWKHLDYGGVWDRCSGSAGELCGSWRLLWLSQSSWLMLSSSGPCFLVGSPLCWWWLWWNCRVIFQLWKKAFFSFFFCVTVSWPVFNLWN